MNIVHWQKKHREKPPRTIGFLDSSSDTENFFHRNFLIKLVLLQVCHRPDATLETFFCVVSQIYLFHTRIHI